MFPGKTLARERIPDWNPRALAARSPNRLMAMSAASAHHDDEILRRALEGDAEALGQLLHRHGPDIARKLRIAPKWTRALTVEDVMQVSYVEAFLRIRTLREPTEPAFRAWLTRIAENNLLDAVRSLSRAKRPDSGDRLTQGASGESSRTLLARVAQPDGPGSATQLGVQESLERLMEAIEKLPETYRAVVRAMDLEERSVSDVSEELGRSPGAIHMLRSRAHDRLRDLLA